MNKTKKALTGVAALSMCAAMAFAVTGCGASNDIPDDVARTPYTGASSTYSGTEVQGVSTANGVTTITIGNTAATTGAFATVGVPFNYGLEAYLWSYSFAHPNIKFDFKHYDDEFDGGKGLQFTQQLVEQDKVFALVGHFGTNTIEATCDYITTKGVPMVYAATGVNSLYMEDATGYERAIMSVQPIYKTEGRSMLATAVAPATDGVGLGGSKIGVIYTSDDAGISMAVGIKAEADELGVDVYYQKVDASSTDFSSAVNALKKKKCDVAIIASAQAAFSNIATQFVASNYENVKIITSYVSANGSTMGALADAGVTTDTRKLYSGAWLDIIDLTKYNAETNPYALTDEALAFAVTMISYGMTVKGLTSEEATPYSLNSYAMAGYVAGYTFTQGLDRLFTQDATTYAVTWNKDLTWKNYIEAMESAPVVVCMTKGNTIDLSNGSRLGVTALSLTEYTTANAAAGGQVVRPLTALEDIEKAYKGN